MKTRLRRYFWSAIRPGGHPMEYMGDPWEKLLGFFIAVVILTFYIGVVNLILMFASFSLFDGSYAGYFTSFLGVIPLWFYARYRARRYVLGRTRWRGVRFGLEKGAWGYTWRAVAHWALTLATLGLLWPRMTFHLEKYVTDRTFFGSARLRQGGTWTQLYRPALPLVAILAAAGAWGLWCFVLVPLAPTPEVTPLTVLQGIFNGPDGQAPFAALDGPYRLWAVPVLIIGLIYGALHYAYVARRIMAGHKTADGIALASALRPARITGIYVFGYLAAYLTLVLGIVLFIAVALPLFMAGGNFGDGSGFPFLADMPRWLRVASSAGLYFGVFLLWSVLYNVFVTFPLMRHLAVTTALTGAAGLDRISQRARDDFAEAEGFAEALDLGAAI